MTTTSTAQGRTPDRLIYTDDVAEILKRTPSAVRYMIHRGTAPKSALIGGRRMFRESDVYAWIDAQFAKAEQ